MLPFFITNNCMILLNITCNLTPLFCFTCRYRKDCMGNNQYNVKEDANTNINLGNYFINCLIISGIEDNWMRGSNYSSEKLSLHYV